MADLRDHAVFLSASFPSDDERGRRFAPFDPAAIADGVTAMARAVLMSNGTLVFGGHPTISPLILMVASELDRDGAVEIYQSRYFESSIPDETRALIERGYGRLRMIAAHESNEREPSLDGMRREMLSRADLLAGVFVGGMDGVLHERDLLAERSELLIVPIVSAGGAAREIVPSPKIADRLGELLESSRYPALALDLVDVLAEELQG